MDNLAFVADNFDNLKTLQQKEKTLLCDMRTSFRNKDLNKFLNILHRTGYKYDFENDNAATLSLMSCLRIRKREFVRGDSQHTGKWKFKIYQPNLVRMWRNQDILLQYNSKGKQLIDYVIKSQDDGNLFAFLVFDFEQESESVAKSSKNYFLKLKNAQYTEKTGKSLFQKFYSIIDPECEEICYDIITKLLTEMKQIVDIQGETAVDDVLKMDNEVYKHKILKILITYWKIYSKEYIHYKSVLSAISPYYKLLLTLKEKHEYEFVETFPKYIESMKEKHSDDKYVEIVRDDSNSFLEFALSYGQRRAISAIIDCTIIDPNQVVIKTENSSFDNHNAHFVMSKLLERGFYLGNNSNGNHVPLDWISPKVFENFLDSRVKEDGINGCQIDCKFLVDPKILSKKVTGDHENNAQLLFSRGIRSLENILDNESLKTYITHPVLSTFINLKVTKYRKIFNLNFFIFILFYMIPFYLLLTLLPFRKFYKGIFKEYGEPIGNKGTDYAIFGFTLTEFTRITYYICYAATIYLTCRECLQLFVVYDRIIDYFKKKSNQFEIMIVGLSWFMLYGLKKFSTSYMAFPSAFLIIFAVVELLSILPYPSMSIYMFMLKQVTKTFVKFFTIFILIIIAFTFSFCVVLKPPTNKSPSPWKDLRKEWYNYSITSNNTAFEEVRKPAVMFIKTLEDILEDNETIYHNFENPFTSFQKTLLMLSGEYSIEPYELDSFSKQVLFLFFVFTSFILFNLINGLAISDIQQLKVHAEYLNLKQQIRNATECENVLCDVYRKFGQTSKTNRSWWRKSVMFFMSLLVRKYPYLHKMDNMCIDLKKKTVKYEWDQKRIHILRTYGGKMKKYLLDDESIKKLRVIVERRHSNEENMNEKVESLRNQIAEMKKLIVECLQQKS